MYLILTVLSAIARAEYEDFPVFDDPIQGLVVKQLQNSIQGKPYLTNYINV